MEIGQLVSTYERGVLCESSNVEKDLKWSQRALAALEDVEFMGFVEEVAQLVRVLPPDTWNLWMGNYVEYLAASVVRVEHVGLFLQHFDSCVRIALL